MSIDIKDYPYLYETHLHTAESSRCARTPGREMAKAAKEAGYAGIFVTDHNWGGNCAVDRSLPWDAWVHEYCKGYREAKAWGDENDFPVFFGYEAGYHGPEFLIYGVDEDWLLTHPEIRDADTRKQYELIHAVGGMVIQAHPYREEWYIEKVMLFPDDVDGVEAINGCHSNPRSPGHYNPVFDERAIAYGQEHGFVMTAGSDAHNPDMLFGGTAFKREIKSVQDYVSAILSNEDHILTNGVEWFDKFGNKIV